MGDHSAPRLALIVLSVVMFIICIIFNALAGPGKGMYSGLNYRSWKITFWSNILLQCCFSHSQVLFRTPLALYPITTIPKSLPRDGPSQSGVSSTPGCPSCLFTSSPLPAGGMNSELESNDNQKIKWYVIIIICWCSWDIYVYCYYRTTYGPMYCSPAVLPYGFFITWIANMLLNIGWLLLWDRE